MASKEKIVIDESKCIVCGLCAQVYPKIFEENNNKIVVIGSDLASIDEIIALCPQNAISVVSANEDLK